MKEKIQEARDLASQLHRNQSHKGKPYVNHLDEVCLILSRFGYTTEGKGRLDSETGGILHIAAYLHDVLEDTPIDRYTLEKLFGKQVADLVYAVSDGTGSSRQEKKEKTYERIKKMGTLAVILKLADRIANIEFSDSKSVFRMYLREQPSFREALYIPSQCEDMWAYLQELFSLKQETIYSTTNG